MTIRVGPSRPAKIIAESAKSVKSQTSFRPIDSRLTGGRAGATLCVRGLRTASEDRMTLSIPLLREGLHAARRPRPILSRVGVGLMGLWV